MTTEHEARIAPGAHMRVDDFGPARRAARIGWPVWAISVLLALIGVVFALMTTSARVPMDLRTSLMDIIPGLAALATPTLGAVIMSRLPSNKVGWVFAAAGFASSFGFASRGYSRVALYLSPDLPGEVVTAWGSDLADTCAFVMLGPVLILLFPDGRLHSPRWRPVAWATGAGVVLQLFSSALAPRELNNLPLHDNPFAIAALQGIGNVADLVVSAGLLAALVSIVLRYRRSRGVERQQVKWFAFVAAVGLASTPLWLAFASDDAAGVAIGVTLFVGIPAAAGLAILRYRLYDIDRVVSRTVSYALVTGVLVAAYIGLVVVFQGLTRSFTGSSDLAIAASTLIVAGAFVPVRRRVQNGVDRRFNRARYDAARTIDAFTTRLREQIDIDTLGAELREVVDQAMQPSQVSLWVSDAPVTRS